MMLAMKGWSKRGTDVLEVGDRFGAWVAHTDIVKAALQFNVVDAVHVLVDDFLYPGIHLQSTVANQAGVASDLTQQFGPERVRVTSLLDADSCFRNRNCVLLAGGPDLVYHAAARPYLASVSF